MRILHGKEAVPGSSPGEGLKYLQNGLFLKTTEPLLIREGIADGVGHRPENSPQITLLSDLAEHLPGTEGLDAGAAAWSIESRCRRGHSASSCLGRPTLGTGFGAHCRLCWAERRIAGANRDPAGDVRTFAVILSSSHRCRLPPSQMQRPSARSLIRRRYDRTATTRPAGQTLAEARGQPAAELHVGRPVLHLYSKQAVSDRDPRQAAPSRNPNSRRRQRRSPTTRDRPKG
jgi:hypothetical protein